LFFLDPVSLGGNFALDAVFVVANWIDHSRRNFRERLGRNVSQLHMRMTIESFYAGKPEGTYRLYYGATPDAPDEGILSFVPCRPFEGRTSGFARPTIGLPGFMTPRLSMAVRASKPFAFRTSSVYEMT
jgi:hypothetical protein